MVSFSQLSSVKEDTIFGAARNIFVAFFSRRLLLVTNNLRGQVCLAFCLVALFFGQVGLNPVKMDQILIY